MLRRWYSEEQLNKLKKDNKVATGDGIEGIPVSAQGNQYDLVEDSPFWKELKAQLCGGSNAKSGVNMLKWKLFGKGLWCCCAAVPAAFAPDAILTSFVDSSAFPLNRLRAISTSEGFCHDLNKVKRGLILSDEYDERFKERFILKNNLDDDFLDELNIGPGRQKRNRTNTGIRMQTATKVTGENYQAGKAKQVQDKQTLKEQKLKEKAARKLVKEKALVEKKKKDEIKKKKLEKERLLRVKEMEKKNKAGAVLVAKYVKQRSFTGEEINKKGTISLGDFKLMATALNLGNTVIKSRSYKAIVPEVVRAIDARVIADGFTLLRNDVSDDDKSDDSDGSDDSGDSGDSSDSEESEDSEEEEIEEEESEYLLIFNEQYNDTIQYRRGSVVWFPLLSYWYRANRNDPDGLDNDHWEEMTGQYHKQDGFEEESEGSGDGMDEDDEDEDTMVKSKSTSPNPNLKKRRRRRSNENAGGDQDEDENDRNSQDNENSNEDDEECVEHDGDLQMKWNENGNKAMKGQEQDEGQDNMDLEDEEL